MRLTLYVVHGSHPCAAVEKALEIKGLRYRVIEWPPPLHAPIQRVLFGARTVPALRIDRREKVSGSRAIMRRLDEIAPTPALFPSDPTRRAAVENAERWGDETFQPIGRTLIWNGFKRSPAAMISYSAHSRLPLPAPMVRATAPAIARAAGRLNSATDDAALREQRALPGYLDKIDGWIADGTIGDPDHPTAADLQLASTVRLLMTIADVRDQIAGRPCGELALRLFPTADGEMPAGSLAALSG
jgi:glutathione S-transferase